MDFFQFQDAARKKTGLLIAYFVMAVALMVVSLYAVVVATLDFSFHQLPAEPVSWWQPEILAGVAVITLGIIALGSLYKTVALRQGGRAVAEMLGGRLVNRQTTDLAERRLLNVVEEMALASGIPVPPVYVLDQEPSINAFAAGYTPGDAVIGVNRGTMDYLTRDELQGVLGHEFSHLLNGDMRLNIRLIGLLHGILLIALVGYYLLRVSGSSGQSSRGKKAGGGQLVFIALGALVIGSVGLFFGRLIKASVSRQREYLADASAVQFTRNPDGLAAALTKIGGLAAGSRMKAAEAEIASHLFFGSAFGPGWFQLFATHPPLVARIKRLNPHFDGRFPATVPLPWQAAEATAAAEGTTPPRKPVFARPGQTGAGPIDPVLVLASIGMPAMEDAQYAAHLMASIPGPLAEAIRDPWSARAVVFAMLLDTDRSIRDRQQHLLREREGEPTAGEAEKLAPLIAGQGPERRLPIVEFVQGTLRELSAEQYSHFRDTVSQLVAADQKVSLFEFFLQRILLGHLDRAFYGHRPPPVRFHAIQGVLPEAACLLSLMAHAGQRGAATAEQAFRHGADALSVDTALTMLRRDECSLRRIGDDLEKLAAASPAVKKRVLNATIVTVATDREVTVVEAELLRAIASSLDCPLPPLAVGPIPASPSTGHGVL